MKIFSRSTTNTTRATRATRATTRTRTKPVMPVRESSLSPRSSRITSVALLAMLSLFVLLAADRLYNPQQFRIDEIEVHGQLDHTDSKQIQTAVAQSMYGNYFSLSLPTIEKRIEKLPWVYSATIRRRWPSTLVVSIVEVQPVAKWGKDQWLNFSGDLMTKNTDAIEQDLPLLEAADHQKEAVWHAFKNWSQMFTVYGLKLDQLRLDRRGLWYLTFSSRRANQEKQPHQTAPTLLTMIVKQENAEVRIERFMKALPQHLLTEFSEMRAIDLRHPNGFAVRWKTDAPKTIHLAESQ